MSGFPSLPPSNCTASVSRLCHNNNALQSSPRMSHRAPHDTAGSKYALHREVGPRRSHHSSIHSHSQYPDTVSSMSSVHRSNPASDPSQYTACTVQHDKLHRMDEDSPCADAHTSVHRSAAGAQAAAEGPPPSHTSTYMTTGRLHAVGYSRDTARREAHCCLHPPGDAPHLGPRILRSSTIS